jgi:predicted TIM-barrel fold metal-dependent hydrolase
MRLTRRQFIHALGGATLAAVAAGGLPQVGKPSRAPTRPLVDFHVHLFGIGDGRTGCWLSDKQKEHWNYRYLMRLLDLKENGRMDQDYVDVLVAQLKASSIQKAVLQAWDCRYDQEGAPDLAHTTSVFVPNDYLFQVVNRYPDLFIACASINPRRKDALQELDKCAQQGARMVKLHPPTMDVDPADPDFREFYRSCARSKIILMVHTGAEHAADIVGLDNCDPAKLRLALDEGCTVIAAHAGMGAFFDREDFFPSVHELVHDYPDFYFDTAVLASMFRWRNLPRILEEPELLSRAIHGSDFPFPSNALSFWNQIAPTELAALVSESNLLERDLRLKRALGVPPDVFERGASLLTSPKHIQTGTIQRQEGRGYL